MDISPITFRGRLGAAFGLRPKTWPALLSRAAWSLGWLRYMQRAAIASVEENLRQHVEHNAFPNPDDIFGPFTGLVQFSLDRGVPTLATDCWPALDAAVTAAEGRLQAKHGNPAARIHKGSPYFNIGACHFVAGDLESGFRFLAMAGEEDAHGGGNPFPVVLGDHILSRQFLIAPLAAALLPGWAARYHEITAHTLDEAELVAVIKRAALRPTDGMQLLVALHRLLKAQGGAQTDWTRYLRTRALAELLVALESMLRRIHPNHTGELQSQFEHMFSGKADYNGPFGTFHGDFLAGYKPPGGIDQRRTPGAVDWSVNQAIARIAAAPNRKAKAGLACYVAVRLRNTLLHVLESNLQIYGDEAKCLDMFGVCLATFRIAMDGEDGTL